MPKTRRVLCRFDEEQGRCDGAVVFMNHEVMSELCNRQSDRQDEGSVLLDITLSRPPRFEPPVIVSNS